MTSLSRSHERRDTSHVVRQPAFESESLLANPAPPTSPPSGASASGGSAHPVSRLLTSEDRKKMPRDGLSNSVLIPLMAGDITRTQAWKVDEGTCTLDDAIKEHAAIHAGLHLARIDMPQDLDDAGVLRQHEVFVERLRILPKHISQAFSKGRLTLLQALWLQEKGSTDTEMQHILEEEWSFVHTPNKVPAVQHPHSSGGIMEVPA